MSQPGATSAVSTLPVIKSPTKKPIFDRHICGDKFGTSLESQHCSLLGMLYQSRLEVGIVEQSRSGIYIPKEDNFEDQVKGEVKGKQKMSFTEEVHMTEEESGRDEMNSAYNPKQRLAITLRNWSTIPVNDKHMLEEGAVEALIALSGLDDQKVKRCCAEAFYHLTSRSHNRAPLLALGATSGLVSIVGFSGVRNWDVALHCALSFCNLSLDEESGTRMAREGASICVVNLFSIQHQALLRISVQTLYNMTCVREEFPGLDRISKIILTLPGQSPFDLTLMTLKALVNCVRYSSVRHRIVEDGILNLFAVTANSIPSKEYREDAVLYMATAMRSLAKSKICRLDMLSKGAIDIIQQLMPFCNDKAILYNVKALHDLLENVSQFPAAIFEVAVNTATDVISFTENQVALQYVSSILYTATMQENCRKRRLINRINKCLPKLLAAQDSLTQFFAISASGCIFANSLSENAEQLAVLLRKFMQAGFAVTDPVAIQGMAMAIAMLSQENQYMEILSNEDQLSTVLNLVLSIADTAESFIVKESCVIAICRVTLKIGRIDRAFSVKASKFLTKMLHEGDINILLSSLLAIRTLAYAEICLNELLSKELLLGIAEIALTHQEMKSIARTCVAVLAITSYHLTSHKWLCTSEVIDVLFSLSKSEDNESRELVGVCFCNISTSDAPASKLIDSGIMKIISDLTCSTNEFIQLLCARCICNLTCSTDHHKMLIDQDVMKVIEMICQVRSSSPEAKELCARALLNLMNDDNMEAVVKGGVDRAFAAISSTVRTISCQKICGDGLLHISMVKEGRVYMASRINVLEALFRIINVDDFETGIVVAKAACNLLSQDESRARSLAAGGFDVLKIISCHNEVEFQHMAVKTIISLLEDTSTHAFLSKQSLALVVSVIVLQGTDEAFAVAVHAVASASRFDCFKRQLTEKGYVDALITGGLLSKIKSASVVEAVARSLCNITTLPASDLDWLVREANILVVLHILFVNGDLTAMSATMIGCTLRNLSSSLRICKDIVEHNGLKLFGKLLKLFSVSSSALCRFSVYFMQNLAMDSSLHETMIEQKMMGILESVVFPGHEVDVESIRGFQPNPSLTGIDVFNVVRVIDLVAATESCRFAIVHEGVVDLFRGLSNYIDDSCQYAMASSLCSLSASAECRQEMVNAGAPTILVVLSKTNDVKTQTQCATAVAYLSEITIVDSGMPTSMRSMTVNTEANRIVSDEEITMQGGNSQRGSTGRGSFANEIDNTNRSARGSFANETVSLSSAAPEISQSAALSPTLAKYSADHIKEEEALVAFDYTPFKYAITGGEFSIAPGGMAKALVLEPILPRVRMEDKKDLPCRNDELTDIPVEKEALPKETFQSNVKLVMKEILQREGSIAATAAPTAAPVMITPQSPRSSGESTPLTSVRSSPVVVEGRKVFESATPNRADINKKKKKKQSTNMLGSQTPV